MNLSCNTPSEAAKLTKKSHDFLPWFVREVRARTCEQKNQTVRIDRKGAWTCWKMRGCSGRSRNLPEKARTRRNRHAKISIKAVPVPASSGNCANRHCFNRNYFFRMPAFTWTATGATEIFACLFLHVCADSCSHLWVLGSVSNFWHTFFVVQIILILLLDVRAQTSQTNHWMQTT